MKTPMDTKQESEIAVDPAAACSGFPDYHCQNGPHGDLCWAARLDGIVCSHDSCDVEAGIVDYDPTIPPRERIPNANIHPR
jgi:hypothetical protein